MNSQIQEDQKALQHKYRYQAFGLQLESDFELEGLLPAIGAETDVWIREGEVKLPFPGEEGSNSFYTEGPHLFAFRVQDIGSFCIRNGNEMLVEVAATADSTSYNLFILGTCIGAVLMQRGQLPIHGSALVVDNKGIVITGHSGAGKSTLTAYLYKMGFPFLADDITPIQLDEQNNPWMIPAFPRQKLWRDTAVYLFGSVDSFERIPGIRDKFHVPMEGQFHNEQTPFAALFEVSIHEGDQVVIEEITGAEKLNLVLQNTYRFEMVGVTGALAQHFRLCSEIANRIKVYRLKRPAVGYTVEQQTTAIRQVLG